MRAQDRDSDRGSNQAATGRPVGRNTATGPAAALLALQRTAGNAAVVQAVAEERHQHDADCGHAPAVQRRSLVHEVLRSPGRPMDAPLRTEMESRFQGADFSGVRVHSDTVAQRSALDMEAKGYTSGSHIVDGGSMTKEDWAHELTHYMDQQAGPVPGTDNGSGVKVSDPSDWGERRAVENARKVMSGPVPPVQRAVTEDTHAHAHTPAPAAVGSAPVQRVVEGEGQEEKKEETPAEAGARALKEAKNPQEMMAALEMSGHSGANAYDLMQYMTSQHFAPGEGQAPFDMLAHIKDAGAAVGKASAVKKRMSQGLLGKKWTIRHYTGRDPKTEPSFHEIVSTYDNVAAGRASANTNVADWRSLGNIKFSFYLVAVDGQVPPRNWLNNTHWYAEWDLDDIANCWISPDLLERMNKNMDADGAREAMKGVKAFSGTGRELKELLAISVFGAGNDPAAALDNAIGGAFELKVPGGLTVTKWHKK
ncbi:DUF4157 domain-containing protein [Streptomyces sp. NPDC088812]|uniref:eCIS core domain-containing protein n=1 Tax=Streptomyces sp. NPDC088812 TaxID=3365905 RepID=UPI003825B7AA